MCPNCCSHVKERVGRKEVQPLQDHDRFIHLGVCLLHAVTSGIRVREETLEAHSGARRSWQT